MNERIFKNGMRFISRKWNSLSAPEQFRIAQEIGGARHYNSVLILMRNLPHITLESILEWPAP